MPLATTLSTRQRRERGRKVSQRTNLRPPSARPATNVSVARPPIGDICTPDNDTMSGMTWLEAIVIGGLQGVAELFPVSSLGHSVLIPAVVGGAWARDL